MNKPLLLIFASALALGACSTRTGQNAAGTEQKEGSGIGIDLSWMDKSAVPGDDFYKYANGNWKTEIPADRSRIGGFWIADQVREKNTRVLFDNILTSKPTRSTAQASRRQRPTSTQSRASPTRSS